MKKTLLWLLSFLMVVPLWAQTEVRLAVHGSFSLPKDVIAKFEQQNQAKVSVVKVGSGNELVNKLIVSRHKPIADAVFGLDNGNIEKARKSGILAAVQPQSVATVVSLPQALAVDYGFVTINYDKNWFEEQKLALPQSLEDLTKPAYANLLAVPSPGTSTPGLAFLLANIGGLGEEKAFEWWAKMRANGVKITKGWSEAYNTEFTLNGGSRPMMVGYASSPAAEVFYSKGKLSKPNMGNLFLKGGVFRQIEGAAVLNNAREPELAAKLVQYLQSEEVQKSVSTSMWVYPAVRNTQLPAVMAHSSVPKNHWSPSNKRIADKQQVWINRWIRTVMK